MVKSPHWSKVGEAGTIAGMKALLLVYQLTGRWGFRVILFPVMCYYYLSQPRARQASQEYLARVQAVVGGQQRQPHSLLHFMSFGETLLDKFLIWMGKIKREDVVFHKPELFQQLDQSLNAPSEILGGAEQGPTSRQKKQGAVIVVSHLGNTEICSALAHQLPDTKLTILVYTQHAEKFNALMKRFNSSQCIELLQVTEVGPGTAMMLSERVEAGELVVIAGDRTPVTGPGRVSQVNFLGYKAPMPQGAFILASLLKCPVYLMFCLKEQGKYHIYLELFSEKIRFARKEREQAIEKVVQDYATRLEHYCLKAPLQWFNFFPFWQDSR